MLIRSKLAPPFRAAEVLERAGLVHQICEQAYRPLILINAPAGYGKTTLLAQCYDHWRRQDVAVAWYSADDDRFESEQFFAYLIAALGAAGLPLPYSADAIEAGLPGLADEAAARAVLVALEASEEPVRLIIDDYHLIASPAVDAFINYIVKRMPVHAAVLLASRGECNLPLAALRAGGSVATLTQRDLRFDEQEARGLFGRPIEDGKLQQLIERTEGWPAALQLLRYRLAESPGDEVDPNLLIMRTADLASYLAEQVVSGLAPDVQDFLLRTSVPNRICAELADHITERSGGWEMLDRLHRLNLFVTALDPERNWYRYHPLLRDFLRQRLERTAPAELARLQEKAAFWLADQGMVTDALQQASAAGKMEIIAAILEAVGGWRIILYGGGAVLAHLRDVDVREPTRFPRVALAKIYIDGQQGRTAEARVALEALKKELKSTGELDRDPQLMVEMLTTDVSTHIYEDSGVPEEKRQRLEMGINVPGIDDVSRVVLAHMCAVSHHDAGHSALCRSWGEQALERARFSRVPNIESYAHQFQGLAHLAEGRRRDAETAFRRALDHDMRHFGEGSVQIAVSSVLLARTVLLADALSEAEALLAPAVSVIGIAEGWYDPMVARISADMWIHARSGRSAAAADVLAHGRTLAEGRHLHRLKYLIRLLEIRLAIFDRRFEQAADLIEQLPPPDESMGRRDPALASGYLLARAISALLGGGNKQLRDVVESLSPANWQERSIIDQVEAHLIAAAANARLGLSLEAASNLRSAFSLITREGLDALPLQLGELLSPAFKAAREHLHIFDPEQRRTLIGNAVEEILPAGEGDARSHASPTNDIIVTAREIDVLRGLADGLSSKEMARVLGVAESTIKTHRLNLYRKLQVATRSKAIAAARNMGVI